MSITKTLLAGVAGTVLLSAGAMAAEPLKLTDAQLDDVTAGSGQSDSFFADTIGFGFGLFEFRGFADAKVRDSADFPPSPGAGFLFETKATGSAGLSAGFQPLNGIGSGGVSSLGLPTPQLGQLAVFSSSAVFNQ